jgi:hypothetical protein
LADLDLLGLWKVLELVAERKKGRGKEEDQEEDVGI